MKKLFFSLVVALIAPLALAASTSSIRAPGGDIVEIGDSAGAVQDKLGPPARVVAGGSQTTTQVSPSRRADSTQYESRTVHVEYWTYVLDRQKYVLTLKGGRVTQIDWDNLP